MLSCENCIFYQPLQLLYKAFAQNQLIQITHFVVMLKRALCYHGTVAVRIETESINFISHTGDYKGCTDPKCVRILVSYKTPICMILSTCTVHSDLNCWPFPTFF